MRAFFFLSLVLFGCANAPETPAVKPGATDQSQKTFVPELSDSIEGDFDGDGKKEWAVLAMTKDGSRNLPANPDDPAKFEVLFRNGKIKPLDAGCCDLRLVKEDDLDDDGGDEISVFGNEGN
ncbi:MAG TPA: hypothetical protein VFU15_05365, partial [Bacteroidia bacterium]|nr:hypothetical protein [Bacteroidia bacterium]